MSSRIDKNEPAQSVQVLKNNRFSKNRDHQILMKKQNKKRKR